MTEAWIVLCVFGGVAILAWVLWLIMPSPQYRAPQLDIDLWCETVIVRDLDRIIAHEIEEQYEKARR